MAVSSYEYSNLNTQTLQFHSDSEPGLGPLVAGLSLGSPALMHFRLLAKHEPAGEQRQIAMTFVLRHVSVAGTQMTYPSIALPRVTFWSWTAPKFRNTTSMYTIISA